jgi:hypothetical protein
MKLKNMKKFWIPLFSTLVALSGVLSVTIVNISNNNKQLEIKKYEFTFQAKYAVYSSFMQHVSAAFYLLSDQNQNKLNQTIDLMESDFVGLEPFLRKNERSALRNELNEYIKFLKTNNKDDKINYAIYRNLFSDQLNQCLFGKYLLINQ